MGLPNQRRGRDLIAPVVCGVQGLALCAVAVASVLDRSDTPAADAALVVTLLGVAALALASARGLWRGRRWARGPAITLQLLIVLIAFSYARLTTFYGWVLLLPAAAALWDLLTPQRVTVASESSDK